VSFGWGERGRDTKKSKVLTFCDEAIAFNSRGPAEPEGGKTSQGFNRKEKGAAAPRGKGEKKKLKEEGRTERRFARQGGKRKIPTRCIKVALDPVRTEVELGSAKEGEQEGHGKRRDEGRVHLDRGKT